MTCVCVSYFFKIRKTAFKFNLKIKEASHIFLFLFKRIYEQKTRNLEKTIHQNQKKNAPHKTAFSDVSKKILYF